MKKLALLIGSVSLLFFAAPLFSAQHSPSLIDLNRAFLEEKQRPTGWERDPFILPAPPAEQTTSNRVETEGGKTFSLTAIIYRNGEGAAIINHRILRLGDRIEGMMVQEILSDRVILRDGSKRLELKVDQFLAQ